MSRAFVEAITDLAENVATLQFACTRGDRYAQQILKNGTNYVAVNLDGKKAFAPSRFVGYLSNSPAEHRAATEKSGTDTDRIINRLLGESPIHSITLDRGFIAFCAEFDIVPSAKARVFWNLPGDFEGVDSVDLDERRDIDEILNRHSGKKNQLQTAYGCPSRARSLSKTAARSFRRALCGFRLRVEGNLARVALQAMASL